MTGFLSVLLKDGNDAYADNAALSALATAECREYSFS
jgi:flagellar basal body rod protein FlgF